LHNNHRAAITSDGAKIANPNQLKGKEMPLSKRMRMRLPKVTPDEGDVFMANGQDATPARGLAYIIKKAQAISAHARRIGDKVLSDSAVEIEFCATRHLGLLIKRQAARARNLTDDQRTANATQIAKQHSLDERKHRLERFAREFSQERIR
jgi:hypothetical protein